MKSPDWLAELQHFIGTPAKELQATLEAIDLRAVKLTKELSKIGQELHKVSSEAGKAGQSFRNISDGTGKLGEDVVRAGEGLQKLEAHFLTVAEASNIATNQFAKNSKAIAKIADTDSNAGKGKSKKKEAEKDENASGVLGKLGAKVKETAENFFSFDHILDTGKDLLVDTAKEAKKAHAEYEQWSTVLTQSYGSAELAAGGLKMIEDYAKTAPFHIENVTESFVEMAKDGIEPTAQNLKEIGNIAAQAHKPFESVFKAIGDGSKDGYKALAELGIGMHANKSDAEHLTATFNGHTEVIKNSKEAIRDYVLKMGEVPGVNTAAADAMGTVEGREAGLHNAAKRIYTSLGEMFGGAFDGWEKFETIVISGIADFVGWVAGNKETVKEFFTDLAEAIGVVTAAYIVFNFEALAVGAILGILEGILWTIEFATNAWSTAQELLNMVMEANPLGLLILLIGGLVIGIRAAWKHCETFRMFIYAVWEVGKTAFTGLFEILMHFGQGLYNFYKGIGETILGVLKMPFDKGAMFKQGLKDIGQSIEDVKAIGDVKFDFGGAAVKGINEGMDSFAKDQTKTDGKKTDAKKSDTKASSSENTTTESAISTNAALGITNNKAQGTSTINSGSSGGKNINVTIQTLGKITITGRSITESATQIRQVIQAELIGAVRDFEVGINNG